MFFHAELGAHRSVSGAETLVHVIPSYCHSAPWRPQGQMSLALEPHTLRTTAEFCRQEGVSKSSFYSWRQRVDEAPDASLDFVELTPASATRSPGIELEVGNVVVRLAAGFSADDLWVVMAVLRERR